MVGVKFEPRETVRLGVIGVGGRGTGMLSNFLAHPTCAGKRDLRLGERARDARAGDGGEKRRKRPGNLHQRRA